MSPRAAWRLEELGFTEVYDYVPSKLDWFANGMPREGRAAETPWAGDLARRDAPKCAPTDRVVDVRKRVIAAGFDVCVVVNDERIVLGLVRGDALSKDSDFRAHDVMELGPQTLRPSMPVRELLESRSNQGVKSWIVTTSHGTLVGILSRRDGEHALERGGEPSSA